MITQILSQHPEDWPAIGMMAGTAFALIYSSRVIVFILRKRHACGKLPVWVARSQDIRLQMIEIMLKCAEADMRTIGMKWPAEMAGDEAADKNVEGVNVKTLSMAEWENWKTGIVDGTKTNSKQKNSLYLMPLDRDLSSKGFH